MSNQAMYLQMLIYAQNLVTLASQGLMSMDSNHKQHIVGTLGYLAQELTRTGKATTSTDVYGYGILLLEVAGGRRPIEPQKNAGELLLVDWVREQQSKGEIVRAEERLLELWIPYWMSMMKRKWVWF